MEKQPAKKQTLQKTRNCCTLFLFQLNFSKEKAARTKEDSTKDVRKQKKYGKPRI